MYSDLPENTIGEKIVKLRRIYNLKREEFAKLSGFHWDTVEGWELHNIMPQPDNMLKISNFFNVPIGHFHEYYAVYFSNPGEKISGWKEHNKLTYEEAARLLVISQSGFARILSGRIKLSFEMYLKLKKLNVSFL